MAKLPFENTSFKNLSKSKIEMPLKPGSGIKLVKCFILVKIILN